MTRKQLIKAISELNLSLLYYKDEVLEAIFCELEQMRSEIIAATPGYRQFSPKEIGGGFHVTGVKSDFPQWYHRVGFKSREQVYCAFRGNSKFTKMVVSEAINRLENGHCDFHEVTEPNEEVIYHTDLMPRVS